MHYRREDLPVWQHSAELSRRVFELATVEQFRRHPGLHDLNLKATNYEEVDLEFMIFAFRRAM